MNNDPKSKVADRKVFATVCSGIGAPEVAATRLGWKPLFSSEIEPFPNAVREHHFPGVLNLGDMTKFHEWPHSNPDVLIAGTPCQAFSIAGLRKGMADPRGNLTLIFLGIIARYTPRWILWENVPGVLSDQTGAFGAFLGGLAELGYGFAYRILDAQYFGVAQRRRRVFVVAHSGGHWQRAAAVLFERESLCGNPPPSRETGKSVAPTISARTKGGGGLGTDFDCDGGLISTATADGFSESGQGFWRQTNSDIGPIRSQGEHWSKCSGLVSQPVGIDGSETGFALRANASHSGDKGDGGVNTNMVVHSLRAHGFDASEDGTGRGTPLIPIVSNGLTTNPGVAADGFEQRLIPELANPITGNPYAATEGRESKLIPEICSAVTSKWAKSSGDECQNLTIAFPATMSGTQRAASEEVSCAIGAANPTAVAASMAVRRLTPRECERLQGFPDDFTNIIIRGKPAADGPRYKSLGNSMAVPVIEWILRRMDLVDDSVPLENPHSSVPSVAKTVHALIRAHS